MKDNFLFVHVPKTGGNTINTTLRRMIPGYKSEFDRACAFSNKRPHRKLCWFYEDLGSMDHIDYIFAFVRNPWDRFVSLYEYYHHGSEKFTHKHPSARPEKRYTFKDFCEALVKNTISPTSIVWERHFDPQVESFCGMCLDFIGRTETLDADFRKVCKVLNLPSVNLGVMNKTSRNNYKEYYDDSTINIIGEYYREDIKEFNYTYS